MKIINKKENQITFSVKMEDSLANAVRRFANQIPILAIDDVEISRNDSPLYDETIAHRLGLVPLKMNSKINEKTTAKIKVSANKEGIVFSKEFEGDVEPVYDKIPITFLNKGQELKLVANAKIGRGSEHSRFSPGLIFYREIADLKIDKNCPKEVVDICPQKIIEIKDNKLTIVDNLRCDLCSLCSEFCERHGKEGMIGFVSTGDLIVTVESFGQINPEEIFKKAIEALKKDLEEFGKKLK